jgi:hypothetical protein
MIRSGRSRGTSVSIQVRLQGSIKRVELGGAMTQGSLGDSCGLEVRCHGEAFVLGMVRPRPYTGSDTGSESCRETEAGRSAKRPNLAISAATRGSCTDVWIAKSCSWEVLGGVTMCGNVRLCISLQHREGTHLAEGWRVRTGVRKH